ncbi:unnamed protein product [Bursaphelenchus xylophilus]|uniref:(pine wood nematode) hypothetical protein n=1 Tax=Bursaphelenchus xylophilus TaxID=6326 RepID=A0A1I7S039_BURXY|nr:unnamed protein product [Bursaphelenchus xylophilus]CAG9109038.1 unnamed protein product [Bursaphelenchus xylophilus]
MTLFLALARSRGVEAGLKYIVLAAIPTIILLVWPKESCDQIVPEPRDPSIPIDYIAIPRFILAAVLVLLTFGFGIQWIQHQLFFVEKAIIV